MTVAKSIDFPAFSVSALSAIIPSYEHGTSENHGLGQHGICLRRPRFFHLAALSPRGILHRREDRGRHSAEPERQVLASLRPPRQSCGVKLLGNLVPALCRGNTFSDRTEQAHLFAQRRCSGCKRG